MTTKDKDLLEGLAISVACHVLPARKVFREPISYSYNGVILPKLPEWDREKYPYATIRNFLTSYWFQVFERKPCVTETGILQANPGSGDMKMISWQANSERNGWDEPNELTFPEGGRDFYATPWANFDLTDTEGNVVLAASEPIPVYE